MKMADLGRLMRDPNLAALPIVIVAVIAVALVAGLGAIGLRNADSYAIERQGDELVRALVARAEQVSRQVIPLVLWQEAADTVPTRNLDWMDVNEGALLHDVYGYRQVHILDDADRPIYGSIDGVRVAPGEYARIAPAVSRLVAEVRDYAPGGPARTGLYVRPKQFPNGVILSLVIVARLAAVEGRPSLVTVSTIIPDVDPAALGGRRPYLLVAVADLDDAVLATIARDYGFSGLKWGGDTNGGRVARDLLDDTGGVIAQLSWLPERPATAFVRQLMPALAISLAIFLLTSLGATLMVRWLAVARAAAAESRLMAAASQVALDAVVVADRQGRIVEFNPAAEACFGHARAAVIGSDLATRLIAEPHRVRFGRDGLARMIGSRSEAEALRADGGRFPIEISLGASKSAEGPIVIAFIRDITERLEQERRLADALQKAEASNKAKERFLAVMSHEIRTPLNGVLGVLELLRNTPLTAEQRDLARVASQSGDALLALISDILDVSKMEFGALELYPGRTSIADLVESAVRITASAAAANRNKVTVDIGAGVPPAVIADEVRLRQVLINLLSNAQKFTQGGEIAVTLRRTEGPEPLLEVAVADTGVGIDPARIGELFKEFSRLDPGFDRRTEGTGLGLAICKRIVGAMGGEVGADGRPGEGSRFWFRIPLRAADGDDDGRAAPSPPPSRPSPGRGYRILVAEDNPTNLIVTRGMLEAGGHAVGTAVNGRDAIREAASRAYDLILMDMSMPEMDGLEATRRIRELPSPAGSVPIIALTAHVMAEDMDQAVAAGVSGYLVKPIRQAELLARVRVVVEQHRGSMHQTTFDRRYFAELCVELPGDAAGLILRQYQDELATRLEQLRAAAGRRDGDGFGRLCHAVAGSSASVGAIAVAAMARELETQCRNGATEAAMAGLPDLEAVAGATREAVEAELAALAAQ